MTDEKPPKPLPANLLPFNAGRKSSKEQEPDAPDPPEYLTALARPVWVQFAAHMVKTKMWQPEYEMALAMLSETEATRRQLAVELRDAGLHVEGSRGQERAHPLLKVLDEYGKMTLRCLHALGLSARHIK